MLILSAYAREVVPNQPDVVPPHGSVIAMRATLSQQRSLPYACRANASDFRHRVMPVIQRCCSVVRNHRINLTFPKSA